MHVRRTGTTRRPLGRLAVAVGMTLIAGGCGTRVTQDEATPAQAAPVATPVDQAAAAAPVPAEAQQTAETATPVTPAPSSQPGTARPSTQVTSPSGASGTAAAPSSAAPTNRNAAPATPGATAPKPGPAGGPAPASPAVGGSAIKLASVGSYSGPAGATLSPMAAGAQLWSKAVNARGGINGHPVKFLVFDDGSDPARHRAQVQQAIEQEKVIAFVMNAEGITGRSSVSYIESKRIPVIGSEGGSPWFYESPMYFPQASSGDAYVYGGLVALAGQAVPQGKKKLAIMTCVEADICDDADRVWSSQAKALGMEVVYKAKISIAQVDFTAECLSARNAGAVALLPGTEATSIGRLASSCARQGFKPLYGAFSGEILDSFKSDPNLQGLAGSSFVFPWFQTGTPATDEYQAALKLGGGGLRPGVQPVTGWVAGKVFERAAAKMPEPPTSEAVLKGLWGLNNDTLGGITAPLMFPEGGKAVQTWCGFTIVVKDNAWVSPDNFKLTCKPPA